MSNSDHIDRLPPELFLRPHILDLSAQARLPLEAIPDLLVLHDCDGICLAAHVPPGFPILMGGEPTGQNVLSLFPWHCSQEDLAFYRWIDKNKESQVIERVLPGARSHRFFEIRIVPVAEGKLLSIAREVTQRREREDDLRAALLHKDTLLKELHHRVKNNLQVMISLLGLQSSRIEDPVARELARESERRVRSMAIVHNYLDTSRDDGRVNLARYLRAVVDELFHAFGVDRWHIEPIFDIESVELPWELATNLSLIVNELVSNALKYAFPPDAGREAVGYEGSGPSSKESAQEGDRCGLPLKAHHCLRIHLSRPTAGGLRLVVSDNGCGIPPEATKGSSQSIGLQLVATLVEQLDGHLQIETNRGTHVSILYPPEAPAFRGHP